MMLKRLKQLAIGGAVLAGLALGGSASAGAATASRSSSGLSPTGRYLTDHEQYVRHHERLASEPGGTVTSFSGRR